MRTLLRTADGRGDLALAIGLLLFAALFWWEAAKLPPPFFDPLGSAAVPKAVALVLALLAVVVVAQRIAAGTAPLPAEAELEDQALVRNRPDVALASIAITVLYAGVMHYDILGFREASVVFVVALGAVLARFEKRVVLALIPIALLIGIGFTWIFTEVLYIDLPLDSRLF